MKPHYNVVAAVVRNNGEILCMQRGPTRFSYTSYKYEFPGGKVEPGETPRDALRRELQEELDLTVGIVCHLLTCTTSTPTSASPWPPTSAMPLPAPSR